MSPARPTLVQASNTVHHYGEQEGRPPPRRSGGLQTTQHPFPAIFCSFRPPEGRSRATNGRESSLMHSVSPSYGLRRRAEGVFELARHVDHGLGADHHVHLGPVVPQLAGGVWRRARQ
jgi:hypothetical protein